jgi:lysophospholipase L1-like esterase
VVALGDSVTAGGPCGCTTFPTLYAQKVAYARGIHTHVQNLGVNGEDSAQLLSAVRDSSSTTSAAVRGAAIDLVTIGANDFSDQHDAVTGGRCLADDSTACVDQQLASMESNLEGVLSAIHHLRAGRPTAVLVTGYWNVFEDGAVARKAFSDDGVRATRRLTALVNDGIRRAATRGRATYVDLTVPFIGPRTSYDATSLLGPDGDHPNAAGHQLIATRLLAAGLPGLAPG